MSNGHPKITMPITENIVPMSSEANSSRDMKPDYIPAGWTDFIEALHARLEAGAQEYGDSSYTRPPGELAGEIEEELLDVVGWAFFLWLRVRSMNNDL